jgi:hypothetical protein
MGGSIDATLFVEGGYAAMLQQHLVPVGITPAVCDRPTTPKLLGPNKTSLFAGTP